MRKQILLRTLEHARLPRARAVFRLHESLCFIRAFPETPEIRAIAARMLDRFAARADLRRHRAALANTGVAGTEIRDRFYWAPARWLAQRRPAQLTIDWPRWGDAQRLETLLPHIAHFSETPGLDEHDLGAREWIRQMKSPRETDARFLVARFEALRASGILRETLYDDLDPPLRLAPSDAAPSRTNERLARAEVHYQIAPLDRALPDGRAEARRAPPAIRRAAPREAAAIIEIARSAMVTRCRDLDAFFHADARDVHVARCERGLEIAVIGVVPERRLLLEAVYGYLVLKNGAAIGYGTASALFESVEIAYNIFETYRGAEAGAVFGRILAVFRQIFAADTFVIDPYQVGAGNTEALRSGAWWFYQKQGFAPRDAKTLRLMRTELRAMRARPSHRSSIATLKQLSASALFLDLARPRAETLGAIPLGNAGLAATRTLAARFGSDRERAVRECAREAAALLGAPRSALARWRPAERLAWTRWAPLILSLPRVARWNAADKRALVGVVRAKGGERESEFVARFDAHRSLRRAIARLGELRPRPTFGDEQ
ncbi:MAG: hypothetical protein ACKVU1_14690 [bacterium]